MIERTLAPDLNHSLRLIAGAQGQGGKLPGTLQGKLNTKFNF